MTRGATPGGDAPRRLAELLSHVPAAPDEESQSKLAAGVLALVFDIGLALGTGALDPGEVAGDAGEVRGGLERLAGGIAGYVADTVRLLLPEVVFPDVFAEACERRSSLQFAIDLYWAGSPPPPMHDLDYLDELLGHVAARDTPIGAGDVPAGIPPSHWWWRAPEDGPPGDSV